MSRFRFRLMFILNILYLIKMYKSARNVPVHKISRVDDSILDTDFCSSKNILLFWRSCLETVCSHKRLHLGSWFDLQAIIWFIRKMADHKVARDKGSQFYFKKVGSAVHWAYLRKCNPCWICTLTNYLFKSPVLSNFTLGKSIESHKKLLPLPFT